MKKDKKGQKQGGGNGGPPLDSYWKISNLKGTKIDGYVSGPISASELEALSVFSKENTKIELSSDQIQMFEEKIEHSELDDLSFDSLKQKESLLRLRVQSRKLRALDAPRKPKPKSRWELDFVELASFLDVGLKELTSDALFWLKTNSSPPTFDANEKLLRVVFNPSDLDDRMESIEAAYKSDARRYGPRWAKFYAWISTGGLFVQKLYAITPVAKLLDGWIKKLEK